MAAHRAQRSRGKRALWVGLLLGTITMIGTNLLLRRLGSGSARSGAGSVTIDMADAPAASVPAGATAVVKN
jgi:hypothetical protein